eukprot:gene52-647_t
MAQRRRMKRMSQRWKLKKRSNELLRDNVRPTNYTDQQIK